MHPPLSTVESLGRLGLALAVGLLIGLERGWRSREAAEGGRAAGLRTLGLTGLLGGALALMAPYGGQALIPVGLGAAALVLALFQALEAQATRNASATGVIAGLLAFVWGACAVAASPVIAVAGAVATTCILAFKKPLHRWVERLSWVELRAVLVLLVMTALVLPLLPDRTFDPWGALNPRRIWLFAVLIAAVSFVGYAAMRVFGGRGGLFVSALAGGLASSTAATLAFARLARAHRPMCTWLAGGTLIADAVMGGRVLILAAVANRAFAFRLAWTLGAFTAVSALLGGLMLAGRRLAPQDRREPVLSNPLEVGMALRFAAAIALVMLLAKLLATTVGTGGVHALAAASGLADVDAVTLSAANMAGRELTGSSAALAVVIAVAANTVAKTVIAGVAGTPRHAALVGLASAAAVAASAAVAAFVGI